MEFLKKDSFNNFAVTPIGDQINGRLLATFDASRVAGGNFRIVRGAVKPVNFCFPGAELFIQPQLACFEFITELEPEDLYFPHNLLSTAWEDLPAAVAEKRIKVFNPSDPQQNDTSFRSLLHSFKEEAHACFRWNVCTHEDLTFSLDLQGLPLSAAAANSKQALTLDSAPSIRLASQPIIFPPSPRNCTSQARHPSFSRTTRIAAERSSPTNPLFSGTRLPVLAGTSLPASMSI
jgi:hypothetical protein